MISEDITLHEHQELEVSLSSIEVETLLRYFRNKIDVMPSFEYGRYLLKAQSYAGMIVLPSGRTIYIHPKIPIQTLFALLARVYDPDKEVFKDTPQPYTTIRELFEFIVVFFITHTEDLISRGLLRGYQSFSEDSQAIRGHLLIADTLQKHPGLYDRHWCCYRRFSIDIPENRILLWVTFVLRSWNFVDLNLFSRLYRIQHTLVDVELDPYARLLFDRFEFHRLNDFYQPALTLARVILDHLSFSGSQGDEPFLAYLINMNWLFQKYLAAVLGQEMVKMGYWVKEEEAHPLDFGRQINIKPDILLYYEGRPLLIIDAKYKLSAVSEDIYEMLAYCHAIGLNQAILVHPVGEQAPSGSVLMRGPGDIKINYLSLDLSGGTSQINNATARLAEKVVKIIT